MTKSKKRLLTAAACALILAALCVCLSGPIARLWRSISYDWTAHTDAERLVKAYADQHGLLYGDYPESLIALLERNPETEKFVLEYPLWEETPWDLSDFDNTAGVPLFLQWDQRWGYQSYGSDVLGITGCGPTCLAMAGYYLTSEERFNPAEIADFALKNGYYAAGNGSKWTLISEGSTKLGLKATELPLVRSRIVRALEDGKPVVLVMGPGDFTTTGHYILLTGMEGDLFRVNDPNSIANSEKLWSYERLESQIRNIWSIETA